MNSTHRALMTFNTFWLASNRRQVKLKKLLFRRLAGGCWSKITLAIPPDGGTVVMACDKETRE